MSFKNILDTFSFLVQSCVWDSKNVRFHAKRSDWTILAVVKQDLYVTDWIAWYFKTCVTTGKTWNKSFLKPATCLFRSYFNLVLNIETWFYSQLPHYCFFPSAHIWILWGMRKQVLLCLFSQQVLCHGLVFFFLLKKKNKRTKNCINILQCFQQLQIVQCKMGMKYLMWF